MSFWLALTGLVLSVIALTRSLCLNPFQKRLDTALARSLANNTQLQHMAALVSELPELLSGLKDQLEKAAGEINGKIDALETALENGSIIVSPELQAAIDGLKGSVQKLDDIVPDAPAVAGPDAPASEVPNPEAPASGVLNPPAGTAEENVDSEQNAETGQDAETGQNTESKTE